MNRRALLLGSAALAGCRRSYELCPGRRALGAAPRDAAFDELVDEILATSPDALFDRMADRLRAGATPATLLAAGFHAAVRSVTPSAGAVMHSVLLVHSIRLVGAAVDAGLELAGVLWAIEQAKAEQLFPQTPLPPLDEDALPTDATAARARLVDGLEAFDPDAADTGAAALLRLGRREEVVQELLHWAVRSGGDAHRQIWPAQCFRALDAFGWGCGEDVVRAVARVVAEGAESERTALFPSSVDRSRRARVDGRHDGLRRGLDLLDASRRASPRDLRDRVADALDDGTSPDLVWDTLLAMAAEIVLRGNGGTGLHLFDAFNALRWASSRAATDELRALLLLQAASFVPDARVEGDAWLHPPPHNDVDIDTLPEGAVPADLDALFASAGTGRGSVYGTRPAEEALAWFEDGGDPCAFADRARELVIRKGVGDAHFTKFPAAVLEEAGRADRFWAPRFLATGLLVTPSPVLHEDWPRLAEALDLAEELGLR